MRYKVTIIVTPQCKESKRLFAVKDYILSKIRVAIGGLGWGYSRRGYNPWRDDVQIWVEEYTDADTQFTVGL